MATLAITQIAVETAEAVELEAERRQERGFAVLLVSGLMLFAVAVGGYHPYAEDGGLYLAGVKRLLDPALYAQRAGFVLEPMRYSIFAPVVAGLVRMSHAGLPAVLLGLHLVSIWVTLFAAWMLASRCWARREARVGAVALLACWLGLPIAGTALLFMDPYVTARSFSTPCMVLALVGVLDMTTGGDARRRGLALWLGSLALAAAMHPLMAAYALAASLVLLCVRAESGRVRVWGIMGLCVGALGLGGLLQAMARPESAEYVRVAMTRSYWFVWKWRWFEVVGLVAPLGIVGWSAGLGLLRPTHHGEAVMNGAHGRRRPGGLSPEREGRYTHVAESRPLRQAQGRLFEKLRGSYGATGSVAALARTALVVGGMAVIVALLFGRADSATHLVARLQPLRVFQIVYLVMALVLGAKLGELVLRRNVWRWGVALVVLGGTMLGAARAAYPDSRHIEAPWAGTANPWVRAFEWIRFNTPKDALFALDADYINAPAEDAQCFRAIAERSALADYSKDGGEASITPGLTDEWAREQAAQAGLSSPNTTDAAREAALRPLGVTWVVLDAGAKTALDCPYRNGEVTVCRL